MAAIASKTESGTPTSRARFMVLGLLLGALGVLLLIAIVGGPFVLAKRGDLPLERIYGDFAVSVASRIGAGNQQNPVANDRRALAAGREAYTGSCAVCHGATGDGRGVFGTSSYPNATDLRTHDAVEKSDAQMFWIIRNGLNFTGMPGFADQYSDQDIWSLVTYIRTLQDPSRAPQNGRPGATFGAIDIAPPTPDQLSAADGSSDQPAARGAAIYFAQGCHLCHGAVGDAPGDLSLRRGGGDEATRAIRQGRPGMPAYSTSMLSDTELADLQAYLGTIGSTQRRPDR